MGVSALNEDTVTFLSLLKLSVVLLHLRTATSLRKPLTNMLASGARNGAPALTHVLWLRRRPAEGVGSRYKMRIRSSEQIYVINLVKL